MYTGRPTEWQGKVGLMYLSDYGYATSGGSTTNRSSCLAKELSNWNSSSYSDCKDNDWLYNSNKKQWILNSYTNYSYAVLIVDNSGRVLFSDRTVYQYAVRPSVYLKSSTTILSGEGTLENPYEIG